MSYLYRYRLMVPKAWFEVWSEDRKDKEIIDRLILENGENVRTVKLFEVSGPNEIEVGEKIVEIETLLCKADKETDCSKCERKRK